MNVLTNAELYKVAFLYTFSRLFLLICIIYIPIWINELMKLKTGQTIENIAIVPLAFFASSFVAAIVLKYASQNISQKVRAEETSCLSLVPHAALAYIYDYDDLQVIYSTGSFVSIFGCIIIALTRNFGVVELIGIALLLGAGSSITQVSSMCISSDFIGKNCKNSGLVYSIVTVCDKIFSGIIIFIIEIM
jgi:MFS family permease